jgi:GNAT superfamily N-acetyltransferase
MRLQDIPYLAQQNTLVYWRSPVNNFIAPHAPAYPHHLTRMLRHGITRRYLDSNVLSLVACLADIPDIVVAYGQFSRVGFKHAPPVVHRSFSQRLWIYMLSWLFWAYFLLETLLVPDRATDAANLAQFGAFVTDDRNRYWSPSANPERAKRWVAQSIVVDLNYQGKGLGRLLMKEVLKRAKEDGVPVGLNASPHGEFLYRKLGFKKIAGFTHPVEGSGDGGGIMIWWPEVAKKN